MLGQGLGWGVEFAGTLRTTKIGWRKSVRGTLVELRHQSQTGLSTGTIGSRVTFQDPGPVQRPNCMFEFLV